MADFIYPTNAQLQLIRQEKEAVLQATDPIFGILPPVDVDAAVLMWEQMDNYTGMQQVRGIGGQPQRVQPTGGKRYTVTPGYYGEFMTIDELELTTRRPYGAFAGSVDISDLVAMRQDHLLSRRYTRWIYTGWTLLATGTFTATNSEGVAIHTDTFPLQTYTAATPWTTLATATPIANLRAIKLLGRGKGVSFGRGATLYLNQTMVNALLNNANAADLGGRDAPNGAGINNLANLNQLLVEDDLPMIEVYDEGYFDESGTFNLYLPNGTGVLVGVRAAGQQLGDIALTRNANNPNMEPGAYTKVVDNTEREVPRLVTVHDGSNMAPRLYYPGSFVRLNI